MWMKCPCNIRNQNRQKRCLHDGVALRNNVLEQKHYLPGIFFACSWLVSQLFLVYLLYDFYYFCHKYRKDSLNCKKEVFCCLLRLCQRGLSRSHQMMFSLLDLGIPYDYLLTEIVIFHFFLVLIDVF